MCTVGVSGSVFLETNSEVGCIDSQSHIYFGCAVQVGQSSKTIALFV